VPRSPEPARQRILDTALRLFAAQPIAATSLREIRVAAGQRNAGALHYHFTDKRGLLAALLERELPALADRRRALLASAADRWSVAAVFVLPYAELATGTEHQRDVVQFFSHLLDDVSYTLEDIAALLGDSGTGDATARLKAAVGDLPDELFWARLESGLTAYLHVSAVWARGQRRRHAVADDVFRRDLVTMFVGAMIAPADQAEPLPGSK
jgi:AcrR family transcriptional regulator